MMPGTITREQFFELLLDELCEGFQISHKCQGCPFKRDINFLTGHLRDRNCSLEIVKSLMDLGFNEEPHK